MVARSPHVARKAAAIFAFLLMPGLAGASGLRPYDPQAFHAAQDAERRVPVEIHAS